MNPETSRTTSWLRLAAVAMVLGTLYGVGQQTGITENLNADWLQTQIQAAGLAGILIYIAVFTLGELLYVPGIVFVGAGVLAYGTVGGFFIALFAALVSVCVSFAVVRGIGGNPSAHLKARWVKRALAQLEHHPIRTIVLLRLFLWVSPPLNYALALSGVRFRDFLIGSSVGLAPPIFLLALGIHVLPI